MSMLSEDYILAPYLILDDAAVSTSELSINDKSESDFTGSGSGSLSLRKTVAVDAILNAPKPERKLRVEDVLPKEITVFRLPATKVPLKKAKTVLVGKERFMSEYKCESLIPVVKKPAVFGFPVKRKTSGVAPAAPVVVKKMEDVEEDSGPLTCISILSAMNKEAEVIEDEVEESSEVVNRIETIKEEGTSPLRTRDRSLSGPRPLTVNDVCKPRVQGYNALFTF